MKKIGKLWEIVLGPYSNIQILLLPFNAAQDLQYTNLTVTLKIGKINLLYKYLLPPAPRGCFI